ncbi:hypothetical protein P7K49_023211 [Saguinus oedipus]|uniref:Uncharacterized protein n=1 Tax=Saguinus oedipus TaxID=9490 RepID=A0ABQ9UKZ8_SAGOE|nr:hypothetical protein P7K49_023211 [Saguinus oedipus]
MEALEYPGPGSQRERPPSATRKTLFQAEDPEEDASAVLRAIQVENAALQRALLSRKTEQPASPLQTSDLAPDLYIYGTLRKSLPFSVPSSFCEQCGVNGFIPTSHMITSFQDAEGPPAKPWTSLLKKEEETLEVSARQR